MKSKTYTTLVSQSKFLKSTMAGLAAACIIMYGHDIQSQTLQLRYTFEDGPGTTTTNDPSSAIYPVVLNMVSGSGADVDLHGPANSGVQNVGTSLNLSTNNPAGNVKGAYAFVTNSSTLGNLGVVSNFTATIWVKMSSLNTNLSNAGTRLFVLATNGVTDDGVANTIGINIQSGTGPIPNAIAISVGNNSYVTAPIYYNFPTNVWLFIAMTYDSVSGNAEVYYGSEATPAKLYAVKNIGAGTNFNFSGSASLSIGNRIQNGTDFPGSIDEFHFYTGVGDASFIEGVRQSSTPVVISGLTPDGSVLMDGTNKLSFTASSANGISTNNIKVAVDGVDISSGLAFSGSSTSWNVTYAGLPVNTNIAAVASQTSLNAVAISMQVTDNAGIVTTNSYVYDDFSPTNFTWEGEDYDFNGGQYIDNPVYQFTASPVSYYNQVGEPPIDYQDNGAGTPRVYRPGDAVETEYSYGTGVNGGNSIGEMMRQKILDAFALDPTIEDVDMGYFDGGSGAGLPNLVNYTRTYPTGTFNIFIRAANGSGGVIGSTLSQVTSGWGTYPQTTTNLGTFSFNNTGGWESYNWIPLRDSSGNLVKINLAGTNTFQLTAGNNGGGNVNFLMLTLANTNLPAISGIYPNGTNMFQPYPTFSFTASSPAGVTINTNSINVQFTVTNLLGQGFVTNLTATNGLTITGTATSRNVSSVLSTNSTYTAVISVTDANGSSANTTVSFDTLSPNYTWEAPDYDYNGGQYIPDPIPVDGYLGQAGVSGIDYNFPNVPPANNYRDSGIVGVEDNTDAPLRLQFITNSPAPQPYDMGYYDSGDWLNYTRNFPAGQYNMYVRAADGIAGGGLGNVGISLVTGGWGTLNQTTTNLGSFNIPNTGGWEAFTWVPLRDAGGNLVKFTGGTTNTLKATSAGSQNVFFYALFPADTNLPSLNNVYPNGTAMSQTTNTFSFNILSAEGVSTNSVAVTVNGITVSNLVFSGSANNWNVS
ncbi:MAG: LamG-like jellyroll fold domain-containing protein, partial [Limisphaerales bacterium]